MHWRCHGCRQAVADVGGAGVGAPGLLGRRPAAAAVVRRQRQEPPSITRLATPASWGSPSPIAAHHRSMPSAKAPWPTQYQPLVHSENVADHVEQAVTVAAEKEPTSAAPGNPSSAALVLGNRPLPGVGYEGFEVSPRARSRPSGPRLANSPGFDGSDRPGARRHRPRRPHRNSCTMDGSSRPGHQWPLGMAPVGAGVPTRTN